MKEDNNDNFQERNLSSAEEYDDLCDESWRDGWDAIAGDCGLDGDYDIGSLMDWLGY